MCNRTGEIASMKKDVESTKIFIAFIDHWDLTHVKHESMDFNKYENFI